MGSSVDQKMDKLFRPLAPSPDPKEYAHLTQKERMMAGYPYLPADPELQKERSRARKLCHEFNNAAWDDDDGRRRTLQQLFHPDTANNTFFVEPTFRADYGYNIKAGNGLFMNFDCCILDCAPVTLGDNVMFAPAVHIYAATHPLDPKHREQGEDYYELAYPVTIGNNVWIGGKVVICPGVTVGDNVVIGAGSVVNKSVPSNVVVAGNPARIIRAIDGCDREELKNYL